jgi:hypothetical protein
MVVWRTAREYTIIRASSSSIGLSSSSIALSSTYVVVGVSSSMSK